MTLTLSKSVSDQLEAIRERAQMTNPARTLERAISHIGKQPSYATGDAIKILGRMIVAVRRDHARAA